MALKPETTRTEAKYSYAALQQPAAMAEDGNVATNWREWKSAFDYYLIATGKENSTSREKCALFLHVIGKYGREILEELDLDDATKSNYDALVSKFVGHCDPSRNVNYERHLFFETYQREEGFEKFLSALKQTSKSCEFGQLRSSLILTQIIRGIKDSGMRERLLAKSTLNLEEAVSWCRAAETASRQAEACIRGAGESARPAGAPPHALEALSARAPGPRVGPRAAVCHPQNNYYQQYRRAPVGNVCGNCGRRHGAGDKCWARNVKCYRCNRVGHFAKVCRAKFVSELKDEDNEDDVEDCAEIRESLLLCNLSIEAVGENSESWFDDVMVDNAKINFKLDSGAEVSVISLRAFKKAGFDEKILRQNNCILREVSQAKLPVVGYFEPVLRHQNVQCKQKIYVLNLNCNNLLGIRACRELQLITRKPTCEILECKLDESIFDGLGCLPKIYKIQVDSNVPPVVNASRKVPIKLMPRLKVELENMEKLGIIVKEDSPTDWVSNIVIVERPGKLRVCLDPYHLNKAVRRCHFQLPTLEEVTSNLAEAKYFSKLDAKNGFWMLRLDEDSSKLCTFSTPFGRYRFLRMPFGINCAPEIFHHEMYKIFSMTGVEIFADDILVWGRSKVEHDRRLNEVVRRAIKYGVKFNREKCAFRVTEVNFLGHTFSDKGISPLKSRVQAIINITRPNDRKELERFLGMTNYLARFIPNYSTIASPLRNLLKKEIEFEWLRVHDDSFNELKRSLSEAPVLRFYSPHEPVTVSVDASARGLGACLLQGGLPVAYAARTLTPTEQRWAQIEKEMLAILFGCVRFHQFIYGHNEIIVESDHKPLETIFKKALNETPPRLQRMLLKLQAYRLKVGYKPGKLMHIADTLSRAAVDSGTGTAMDADADVGDDVTVHVNAMFANVDATDKKLKQIKSETQKDDVLPVLIDYYYKGWPNEKNQVKSVAKPYWTIKHELHDVNGILFRNDRVVIPKILRKEMLRRIHEGHLGIEKSKRRARDVMWWPGMCSEIEKCVQRCETCQRHRAAAPREPLAPHPVPERPWEVLAADIFELDKRHYLLIVDYYSKYVEVVYLQNLRSDTTIVKMKSIFSRFGIPRKLVTDNGTQFSSSEFTDFTNKWEITHVTSSPLYPRSNGLAERNVQTIKRLLKKASEDRTDWQLALLNFRNTPITGENYSPAQLLMGGSLNTRLPASPQTLTPKTIAHKQVRDVRQNNVNKMKNYYDRGTRTSAPLSPGDQVRMREGKVWSKARVVKEAEGDRSYWVKVDNGGTYRRNRAYILKPNFKSPPTRGLVSRYDYLQDDVDEHDTPSPGSPQRASLPSGEEMRPSVSAAPAPVYVTRSGRAVYPPQRFVDCT